MFRNIRKKKNEISIENCKELLKKNKRGVLSLIGDEGYPYSFPINFYYEEKENKIYFHSSKKGYKIESIKNENKSCFVTYDEGTISEDGWSYYISSCITFGKIDMIYDEKIALEKIMTFASKYYPNKEDINDAIERSFKAVQIFSLKIEHMSGKRVQEK